MHKKNNISIVEKALKKEKCIALLAPSFVVNFSYPHIIKQLKDLGFDKVVELTFGAKMLNRDYYKDLKNNKALGKKAKMLIASPCPGIVNTIKNNYPKLSKNLIQVDSPLSAMGKICKQQFPKHKLIFISPCDFKKQECEESPYVDFVIDFKQLQELFTKYKIKKRHFLKKCNMCFDKFYNDYTKIYPLSGGLAQTSHVKKILKKDQVEIIDGIGNVMNFLKKPKKETQFLDCLFCDGGCIGGPHTNQKLSINKKKKKVMKYLARARKLNIPEDRKGLVKIAKGISFRRKV
jgi:iron only hydrogenase large subunit-like protein